MIDGRTLPEGEPVYTFVAEDGENFHIHAHRLRQHLIKTSHKIISAPVRKALASQFLAENSISLERVQELMSRLFASDNPKPDPIILCLTPGGDHDVMLVDGHHRYFIHALYKVPVIPAWLVEPPIWQEFRVINIRNLSQDELIAAPLGERNY